MEYELNELLTTGKEIYNEISDMLSQPSAQLIIYKVFPDSGEIDPQKMFMVNTLQFMLYVSCADGYLTRKELNIINYFTGVYMTEAEAEELLESEEFMSNVGTEVPLTIIFLCELENYIYKKKGSFESSLIQIMINYFEIVGMILAASDNNVEEEETEKIEQYLEVIKEYARENTLSPFFED